MTTGPLTNEEAQEKRKELEKLLRRQEQFEIQTAMSTPQGRSFVFRIIYNIADVLSSSFTPQDPQATAHNEGQRAVGIFLLSEIQRVALPEYLLMMDEQLQKVAKKPPASAQT